MRVRVLDRARNLVPVEPAVELHADPAAVADVRRRGSSARLAGDQRLLHPGRCRAPEREPAVAVVVVEVHHERLLAAHEPGRRCRGSAARSPRAAPGTARARARASHCASSQMGSYAHGRRWPRRPPSTRSSTSTAATTTWRPRPTTPSGASRSARSATSRCSGSSRSCSGRAPGPYARSLEIGAGTGYFSLNLLQTGVVARPPARTSARACSRRSSRTRATWTSTSRPRPATPSELPFEDATFDLVLGHAVLHHLPDLDRLLRGVPARPEARRHAVLRRRAFAPGRPHRRLAQARGHASSRRSGGGR